MSWGNRQKRLRSLVGPNTNLCFQVLVCAVTTTDFSTEADFNTAAEEHGIEMGDEPVVRLPKKNYMEKRFSDGYLLKIGSMMQLRTVNAEALYTVVPRDVMSKSYSDNSNALNKIAAQYIPAIEREFPDLKFGDGVSGSNGPLGVEFAFIVGPYDPQTCHPRDLGILKPITVIDQHTIHPV